MKDQSMKEGKTESKGFIPIEDISRKVVTFLYVNLACDAVSIPLTILLSMFEASVPAAQREDNLGLTAAYLGVGAVGVLELVMYITCVVFFCKWMYRAYHNATLMMRIIDVDTISLADPRRAVWSWFIPFYNLYKPYQHMKEMWRASDMRGGAVQDWNKIEVPPEFGWWWATWILSGLLDNASLRTAGKEGMQEVSDGLGIAASILSIAAAILCVKIVRGITSRETHKMHAMNAEAQTK
jgi:hypothetical protein